MRVKTFIGVLLLLCVRVNGFGEELPKISDFLNHNYNQNSRCYEGLLSIYEIGNKYYWQIVDSLYGRDFLVTTTLLKGSACEKRYTEQRYGYAGDRLDVCFFRLKRRGDDILMLQPFLQDKVNGNANDLRDIVQQKGEGAVVECLKAVARDENKVLVEITDLLEKNESYFGLARFEMDLGIGTYVPESSFLKEVRSSSENLTIRFVRTCMSVSPFPDPSIKSEPTRWEYGVSLCLLDEIPMEGRVIDQRVGYFTNRVRDYGKAVYDRGDTEYISRWRLEPQKEQMGAYFSGELVEPIKPIVFYIDKHIPKWLYPYVKKAVEAWQPAFERAGFKNAILARPEPTDDDSVFSIDDARYAYISYKTSPIANAYGPSSVDPRSGEILCSHIGIFNSISDLVQEMYFCQVGAIDSLARQIVLPDTLLGKLIQFVVCHEVGHALGLKHNFKGSSVFPTDSLRDKDFLRKNGYGASIMDYMRFNYAVQPGDDVLLDDLIPRVGEYDYFAIEWGYRYFPNENVAREKLQRWVDRMEINPLYQYDGVEKKDILSQSEDLGYNQMEVNELGIANMQRLMKLPIWMQERNEMEKKVMSSRYRGMLIRYQGYVNQVLENIWGVTERRNSSRKEWEFVGMERQQAAIEFLDKYAFTPQDWLFRHDMFSYYGIDERMNWESICWLVVSGLLDKVDSPLFEKYSLKNYLEQIRCLLFREWMHNEMVSEGRKMLQRRYIWKLKQLAQVGKKDDCRVAIWAEMELQEILALAIRYKEVATDKFYPESVIVGIRNSIK